MKTIYEQTKEALNTSRRMLNASLDVSRVPKGHPLEDHINNAFINLEQALIDLPKIARRASALQERGPMVFIIPLKDMRRWRTASNRKAFEVLTPHTSSRRANRIASYPGKLLAPREVMSRRVLTSREYLKLLEHAIPAESPFVGADENESFSMASLAK